MTALLGGLKFSWLECRKHEKIEKVTGSQDDVFVGVLKKNILNKLALMGLRPVFSAHVRWGEHGAPVQG
jgi:hypothetical protein